MIYLISMIITLEGKMVVMVVLTGILTRKCLMNLFLVCPTQVLHISISKSVAIRLLPTVGLLQVWMSQILARLMVMRLFRCTSGLLTARLSFKDLSSALKDSGG